MRWISANSPLRALAVLFVLLGITYSVVTPIFEAPDEVWHMAYVRHVALHRRLPVQENNQDDHLARQEASQPPLYYLLAAPLIAWIDTDDFGTAARLNPHAAPGLPDSDGNKNMVVPTPTSFPWRGTALAVHVVRFFSLLLGLVTVLATYALGRRLFRGSESRSLALLLAALVAFNPQFLFISASANNDNLMTALAAIAFLLAVDLASRTSACFGTRVESDDSVVGTRQHSSPSLRRSSPLCLEGDSFAKGARSDSFWPPTYPLGYGGLATTASTTNSSDSRSGSAGPVAGAGLWKSAPSAYAHLALLGIVLGLAAITKLTGLLLLPFVLLALVVQTWRLRLDGPRAATNVLASGIIVVGLAAAVAGWWYARNWLLYDDVMGLRPMLAWVGERQLSLREVLGELEGLELSFWAVFGWFNILVEDGIYMVLQIASRVAVFGLIILGIRTWRGQDMGIRPHVLLLALAWAAIVMAGLARWTATTPGSQGRLLFPAIGSFAALLLCGLMALIPQRLRMAVLSVLVLSLGILAAIAPFRYIAPAYARPDAMLAPPLQMQHPVALTYGDREIELLGYTLGQQAVAPGENVLVTLYMQALQPIDRDYSLFIHLWGRDMEWLAQRDSYPGRGSYPTSQWTPGNVIEDRYLVTIAPTATAPARILIEVGFYDFASGRRLLAAPPTGERTDFPVIGRVKLASRAGAALSPQPYRYSFGDQANLLSARVETPPDVQAGSTITVVTTWQAVAAMATDYTIFVHLLDQTPRVVAQNDGEPQSGQYPTGLWDPYEIVTDRRTLTLPAGLPPGRYMLVTGLYLLATEERLPVRTPTGPMAENWAMIGEISMR